MWGVRQFSGRSRPTCNRAMGSPRYARGEITGKEFESMRHKLAHRQGVNRLMDP